MRSFIILIAIFIDIGKSHVPNRNKTSTVENVGVADENVEKVEIRHSKSKDPSVQLNHVYLEDVMYGLKQQNWTGEELCLNKTLDMLHGLQNFSLWSVWNWDAVSSQPVGLLYGNQFQLGNFDECMNPPWIDSHPELRTQYCLVDITLERTDTNNRIRKEPFDPYQSALDFIQHTARHQRRLRDLSWGICLPAACPAHSLEKLLSIMIARSHVGTAGLKPIFSDNRQCQVAGEEEQFDATFYGFVSMMASLLLIAIACTCYRQQQLKNGKPSDNRIIKAFCLVENSANLLIMKKEGSEVLYGIRFISMCFIVMGHQLGLLNNGAISDGAKLDQAIIHSATGFLLHTDLFVDTFFLLSGFLFANSLMKSKRIINPVIYIIRRYVRLIVCFAIVIFYILAIMPHTGTGPLWPRGMEAETGSCRRNWWVGILMMGNYIRTEDMCLVISWYIPADFHYFVIATLLFWCYQHNKGVSLIVFVFLSIASIVVPAVINYQNDLPAIQLFTYEFIKNPRLHKQFNLMYIKSHTRASAYIVGLVAGWMFATLKKRNFKLSKKWATIGAVSSLAVALATLMTGPLFLTRTEPVEAAVYAALNRPLWAAASAAMILCCCFAHVPIISPFLQWYPFVPLSRLAYGLYLIHTLIITRDILSQRNPVTNDFFLQLVQTWGVIVIGLLAAWLVWLVAEAPVNNLLTVLLTKPRSRSSEASTLDIAPTSKNTSLDTVASTSGHLQQNLPNTIQYSSKF